MKYATIIRGEHKGSQGQVISSDRSRGTVRVLTDIGQEFDVNQNWVIVTSYDRSQAQKSRLFA